MCIENYYIGFLIIANIVLVGLLAAGIVAYFKDKREYFKIVNNHSNKK